MREYIETSLESYFFKVTRSGVLESWLGRVLKNLGTYQVQIEYIPGISFSFFLLWKQVCRWRAQPTLSRPNVYHMKRVPRYAARETAVRPVLLIEARGGSAVDIVIVANGSTFPVGRELGNHKSMSKVEGAVSNINV